MGSVLCIRRKVRRPPPETPTPSDCASMLNIKGEIPGKQQKPSAFMHFMIPWIELSRKLSELLFTLMW